MEFGLQGRARPYHHGSLREALVAAAEAELAEAGVEGFSLRAVARRAGVSHAAPRHHFGDAAGLLSALAAESFRRFLATQQRREAAAPPDPRARILAAGLGYIDFALARPALFRLMFGSAKLQFHEAELREAAEAAYGHLRDLIAALGGGPEDIAAVWAVTHGLADLVVSGRLPHLAALAPPDRDRLLAAIIARALPSG